MALRGTRDYGSHTTDFAFCYGLRSTVTAFEANTGHILYPTEDQTGGGGLLHTGPSASCGGLDRTGRRKVWHNAPAASFSSTDMIIIHDLGMLPFCIFTRSPIFAPAPLSSHPVHILLLSSVNSSAAAPAMAGLPVSLTLHWKVTLLPSRHISVTMVWPGMTGPAKRTLMFLKGPNLRDGEG